jgi:hypothetical protein
MKEGSKEWKNGRKDIREREKGREKRLRMCNGKDGMI